MSLLTAENRHEHTHAHNLLNLVERNNQQGMEVIASGNLNAVDGDHFFRNLSSGKWKAIIAF